MTSISSRSTRRWYFRRELGEAEDRVADRIRERMGGTRHPEVAGLSPVDGERNAHGHHREQQRARVVPAEERCVPERPEHRDVDRTPDPMTVAGPMQMSIEGASESDLLKHENRRDVPKEGQDEGGQVLIRMEYKWMGERQLGLVHDLEEHRVAGAEQDAEEQVMPGLAFEVTERVSSRAGSDGRDHREGDH